MSKKLRPLGDRIIVQPMEVESMTKGGIIIPETSKEKPQIGLVLAVGPGTNKEKMEIKEGDKIYYGKYSGQEIIIDNEEYLIIRQSDAFCII